MIHNRTAKRGFSLVELIVVIVIIGLLSGLAFVGIQKAKSKTMNDKVLDDLIAISNAMEQFKRDHLGKYPLPEVDGNMNLNCFYADATYAHDCDTASFKQGMIDNDLLTKRYLQEVPTDPRTGSRYVYGVSSDGKYFQVSGLYEEKTGGWTARNVGNLEKGFHLPSLVRAYDGPNFVVQNGDHLPYSPTHRVITAKLQNAVGVTVNGTSSDSGTVVKSGDRIVTEVGGSVDIYFSDGSVSNLDESSELELLSNSTVDQNDKDGIITKIRLKLFSGKIWNKVARLASASEFNIQTTSAIAGVRGTEFGLICAGAQCANTHLITGSGIVAAKAMPADFMQIDKDSSFTPDNEVEANSSIDNKTVYSNIEGYPGTGNIEDDVTTHDLSAFDSEFNAKLDQLETGLKLSNIIIPHIIGVDMEPDSRSITLENPNLLIKGKDAYNDGTFDIVHLAVFNYETNDVISNYLPIIFSPDGVELIIDDSYEHASDVFDGILDTEANIGLYYIDSEGRESGRTQMPLQITTATYLTEEDIYGKELCEIDLIAPGSTVDFTVSSLTFEWEPSDVCDLTEIDYYQLSYPGGNQITPDTSYIPTSIILVNGETYTWTVTAFDNDTNEIASASGSFIAESGAVGPICGDGIMNGTDVCDGTDFGGATCESVKGTGWSGDLICTTTCSFDTTGCSELVRQIFNHATITST